MRDRLGMACGLFIPLLIMSASAQELPRLAQPVEDGAWVRPAEGEASEPVWGVKGGISVGLWPTGGPRGLFRIYTPYLGQPRLRMINYIAVEPIVGRSRGLSELERSAIDGVDGKAMWTTDERPATADAIAPWKPARGVTGREGDTETLTFWVSVEPFDNGARPLVRVRFRSDRPHEVELATYAAEGSARMKACVLTATMGNYARLRRLWLADETIEAADVWKEPRLNKWGFVDAREWPLDRLFVREKDVVVAATSDEEDPQSATYDDSVPPWWRYEGKGATQYWATSPVEGLLARVNGRTTFWASKAPIPGGLSFENFELVAPFAEGQLFRFGVTPDPPSSLGFEGE